MNTYYNQIRFLTTAALIFLVANPSKAANRQIAGVKLNSTHNGIELRLKTTEKAGNHSSFFTVREDNSLEANLINTELKLAQGKNFQQANPLPGIAEIEVRQVDKNNTQISISGEEGIPIQPNLAEKQGEIVLSLTPGVKTSKNSLKSTINKIKSSLKDALAQLPGQQEKVYSAPRNNNSSPNSNILVPNPEIVISDKDNIGKDNIADNHRRQVRNNRRYLPRAVAPPVGDISISNINASPDIIDLGSSAMVPRLVLRDAPVREVLSLLARSASLNLVFTDTGKVGEDDFGDEQNQEKTISLDLENEPVQEVFNSVLLVSGMNANRKGNTIYVGTKLPYQARNLITRTFRLNQVRAENAALFLASQGAEGQRLTTEVEEIIDPETGRVSQRRERPAQLESLSSGLDEEDDGTSASILKGLRIATDGRLNSLTLIGEPRKVEIATSFLTQLDARRRQVAVNVKVVDVNLSNQDIFDSSFSFGINDSFFVQDGGSAILNFGDTAPPNTAQTTNSQFSPTVIPLEVPGAEISPFFDIQNSPYNNITSGSNEFTGTISPYARPNFGTNNNPFQPGISDINIGDNGLIEYEYGLPGLFQFPKKFLARLEAQVISGNAKILTDPTLVVQEGQEATVKLVQNIVESVNTDIDSESGTRTITPVIGEAGLTLNVNIEQIDDNGFVSLSVNPKVTAVGATQDFDSGAGAVNTLRLLSNRELNSGLIRLRDSQTLILSGIIQDQERTTVSKVPILGDIPLLGSLFRRNDKTNERAEVIVLLTPEIIDEQSGFGYNYRPSKDAREMLQKRGFNQSPVDSQP